MKTYTINQIESMHLTKEDLFKDLTCTFDYALPQNWLDHFCAVNFHLPYPLVLSTTVWVYPENKPLSACLEVQQAILQWMDERGFNR